MSRFIPQADMTADQLLQCSRQARAIIGICERIAWGEIQNGDSEAIPQTAEDMQFALQLVRDLLGPVQDALESHEGLKGRAA